MRTQNISPGLISSLVMSQERFEPSPCGKTPAVASPAGPSNWTCRLTASRRTEHAAIRRFSKEDEAAFAFLKSVALLSVKHTAYDMLNVLSQKTWSHMFNVDGSVSLNLSTHNCVIRESCPHRRGLTEAPITIHTLRSNRGWRGGLVVVLDAMLPRST